MSMLIIMITASLFLALGFLLAFLWANKNKQFEDLETPAWRILIDDKNFNDQKKNGQKIDDLKDTEEKQHVQQQQQL